MLRNQVPLPSKSNKGYGEFNKVWKTTQEISLGDELALPKVYIQPIPKLMGMYHNPLE